MFRPRLEAVGYPARARPAPGSIPATGEKDHCPQDPKKPQTEEKSYYFTCQIYLFMEKYA
jgi:hypothetical protein